jgi:hypothetical protein
VRKYSSCLPPFPEYNPLKTILFKEFFFKNNKPEIKYSSSPLSRISTASQNYLFLDVVFYLESVAFPLQRTIPRESDLA